MKITKFNYNPNEADAIAELEFKNGFPAVIHACYPDELYPQENFDHEKNKRDIFDHACTLGSWLEANLDNIYEYIASRFLQLKNDIIPMEEEMTKEEFLSEICLGLTYATLDGTTYIYLTTGDLFHGNLIVVNFDENLEITDAEILRD